MSGERLCEYELERDRRIARNLETLRRLGLGSNATDGLQSKLSTHRPFGKAPAAPRLHERVVRHQVHYFTNLHGIEAKALRADGCCPLHRRCLTQLGCPDAFKAANHTLSRSAAVAMQGHAKASKIG